MTRVSTSHPADAGDPTQDVGAWLAARQIAFDQWQRKNDGLDARLATLAERSRDAIGAYRAQEAHWQAEQRRAFEVRSAALSEAARNAVNAALASAHALTAQGEHQQALTALRSALATDPANAAIRFPYARALQATGQGEAAAEQYLLAVDLAGTSKERGRDLLLAMVALQSLPPPIDPRSDRPSVSFAIDGMPDEIWDGAQCPMMKIIPAGEFTMGSPSEEVNHQPSENQHRVRIERPFAVGKYLVTRGEFAAFVADTGYQPTDSYGAYLHGANPDDDDPIAAWGNVHVPGADWRAPGFHQDADHPVVCVNFHDTQGYVEWLSARTGHQYRLLSEAEWEYTTRAGTTTPYYWGDEVGIGNAHCAGGSDGPDIEGTVPVGSFPPNPFGLYDTVGNAWTWLQDCWNPNYHGAPSDGSAWEDGNRGMRGRRGGSWYNVARERPGDPRAPHRLRSAARFGSIPWLRYGTFGMRVARDL